MMKQSTIKLGVITPPHYADPLLTTIGLAYLKFGRIEQHLDFLLQSTNNARYVTGAIAKYPDTSFRLKCELFRRIYARHPSFKVVHHIARPVLIGLKKANKSRNRLVHSNVQGFTKGPPTAILAKIVRFQGHDLKLYDGNWTLKSLQNYSTLLDFLSEDLNRISALTMTEAFRQSLGIKLSRTQRVALWSRDRLRRLPRLRIHKPNALD